MDQYQARRCRYNGQQVRNYTLATDMQFSDASGRNIKLTQDYHRQIYAYDNKGKVYYIIR